MVSGIGIKARAFAELIRLDLAFGMMPPPEMALSGFIMLFCISGAANISNDYFDREVDRINRRDRPLPSGRVTTHELWGLFSISTLFGLVATAFFGLSVLALVILLWFVSLLYNVKIKDYGLAGNLVVAFCVGMTIVTGGITVGAVSGPVLLFGVLAFIFDLGEEIASDAMDLEGDSLQASQSLAKTRGRKFALRTAGILFATFFLLTLVPFFTGWFGYGYLLLAVILDLWMIRCTVRLLTDRSIEEGRMQVRRLYLSWGAFVIALVIYRILIGPS